MAVLILDPDVISTPSGYFRFNRDTFVWEEVTPEPIGPERASVEMTNEDRVREEAERSLELTLQRILDDFSSRYDTMVISIAITWIEPGDGELSHSITVKTGH